MGIVIKILFIIVRVLNLVFNELCSPSQPVFREFLPLSVPAPRLDLPSFVVGPTLPPVSAKVVSSIVSRQFVEMETFIRKSGENDTPAFSLLDDKLVLQPAKKRKEITSINTWIEAFMVYMLVFTSYYPRRVSDLLRYALLIMRIAQKFLVLAGVTMTRRYVGMRLPAISRIGRC